MLPTLISILFTVASVAIPVQGNQSVVLATHSMSLDKRYGNTFVNDVFKDNILLTLNYLDGSVKGVEDINWANIEKPFHYEFTLNKGEEFAFHDKIAPEYKGNIVKTTHANFGYDQGFKSDGYLIGDGVCHLASIINWVAKDADLVSIAPTNHDFAVIPEVPREYGTAIYDNPVGPGGEMQNLYITNNKDKPVTFSFDYNRDNELTVTISEGK